LEKTVKSKSISDLQNSIGMVEGRSGNDQPPQPRQEPSHDAAMRLLPGANPANSAAAASNSGVSPTPAIVSAAPKQASEQLALPIHYLPVPPVIEAQLRESDVTITSALVPLKPFAVTRLVYIAMLQAARKKAAHPTDRYDLQIGYAEIAAIISDRRGVVVCKRSIQRAIDRLIDLKYVQRSSVAQGRNVATAYVVLTCPAVMQMLREAGCGHYRFLRGREIQLIRPIKVM
jgi:hypothetical protein